MGDPWGTGYCFFFFFFLGGGGGGFLEGANKNKIGPKTSESAKKSKKDRISFLIRNRGFV